MECIRIVLRKFIKLVCGITFILIGVNYTYDYIQPIYIEPVNYIINTVVSLIAGVYSSIVVSKG